MTYDGAYPASLTVALDGARTDMTAPILFTFPPSLDSEFSRFVLHHYGLAAREERHVLIIQSVVTLIRARTPRIPTLVGVGPQPLDQIKRIIDPLESTAPPERKLMAGLGPRCSTPTGAVPHDAADREHGVSVLPPRAPPRPHGPCNQRGVTGWEVAAVRHAYPLWAVALRVLLRFTAAPEQPGPQSGRHSRRSKSV